MREVVIVDGVRSPIGKFGGGLSKVRPDDLLADVYKGLMERTGVDPALLDDVYAGCGNQGGEDNRDVARMSTLLAGFPIEVSGVTVNRNCASALEAVNQAAKAIIAEEGDDTVRPYADHMIEIPSVSTLFQPLLSTVPLQVFAASVARARGYDVDKPRNLAKSVTVE